MRSNPMYLDNYPDEVTYEILSQVPVESAFQCKRVSRTWRNFFHHIKEGMLFAIGLNNEENTCFRLYYAAHDMIRNNIEERHTYANLLAEFHHPPIENRYHAHPYENYKDVIVGSCNGLVCFIIPNGVLDDPVYVCNPFTRESVNLPRLTSISPKGLVVSGFGLNLHNERYKVVRIYYPDKNLDVGHVEVYTLGGGTGWRNIGEVTYSLCSSPGILVDGVLHWIDCKAMKIVGFSLKDEKFGLVPSPPCLHELGQAKAFRLKILRGCLSVVHHRRLFKCVDIWFYTKDYSTWSANCSFNMNMGSSYDRDWSREIQMKPITFFADDDYDPLLVTEENEVLYWCNKSDLLCFDLKTSTTKLVIEDSSDLGLMYFSATPHVNTRVSLKTLEKENCVVQEWDGCNGELHQQPPVRELNRLVFENEIISLIILACKIIIPVYILTIPLLIRCNNIGWLDQYVEPFITQLYHIVVVPFIIQLCRIVVPLIHIPMVFIFIFFQICIFFPELLSFTRLCLTYYKL